MLPLSQHLHIHWTATRDFLFAGPWHCSYNTTLSRCASDRFCYLQNGREGHNGWNRQSGTAQFLEQKWQILVIWNEKTVWCHQWRHSNDNEANMSPFLTLRIIVLHDKMLLIHEFYENCYEIINAVVFWKKDLNTTAELWNITLLCTGCPQCSLPVIITITTMLQKIMTHNRSRISK